MRPTAALLRQRSINRGEKAVTRSVPAPVGGWNARDSIDEMDGDEAVSMVNWFPGQGEVTTRKGFDSHGTGLTGNVEAGGEFNAGATRKMFACANGRIWDTTTAGAGSSLKSGFSSNRWQWAQFDDASGGARVGLVNGADAPQIYNGTAVTGMTLSGSGLSAATLTGINIFKNRSYFWDTRKQDFWYSAVNALGGGLTKFPLGRVSGTGGNLTAMGTWTRDGGDGSDDVAVFLMSSGDVLLYAGSNPGDAADWSLIGVFKVGAPMGVRALTKIGADLIISTVDGYVPLSGVLSAGRSRQDQAISDKIRKAVLSATRSYGLNFGWQALHYPRGNMAIFNVPTSSSRWDQHVVNTLTGAWTKFTNMNASAWWVFNDKLYFGGSGVVYEADTGTSDGGNAIPFTAQTAWNYLGSKSEKRFVAVQPLFKTQGSASFSCGLGVNFGPIRLAPATSTGATATTPWGSAWGSPWSDDSSVNQNWLSAEGIGHNVSARFDILTSTKSVDWYSMRYRFEPGRGSF